MENYKSYGSVQLKFVAEPTISLHLMNKPIISPMELYEAFKSIWDWDTVELHESSYLIGFNQRNQIICTSLLSIGGLAGTVIDTKKIFQILLLTNCAAFAIAHNHPSGNLKASPQDIQLTHSLQKAAKFMQFNFLEHMIITKHHYLSIINSEMSI